LHWKPAGFPAGSLSEKAAAADRGSDKARAEASGGAPLSVSYAPDGAGATAANSRSSCFALIYQEMWCIVMVKIAPSILSADFANLEREIRRIETADYVHVDVMDGLFVPNISIGIPVVQCIRPVTDLPLDVHLMIVEPIRYAERFCDAGADLVTVHVESDSTENLLSAIAKIHAKGKRSGVVLKPGTPAEAVLPFLKEVELILVMTVEPGFGGQSFMADQMDKVRAIRQLIDRHNPGCELEVDGGVGVDTCRACIEAGANVLVAGSAVYRAENIPGRIRALRGE